AELQRLHSGLLDGVLRPEHRSASGGQAIQNAGGAERIDARVVNRGRRAGPDPRHGLVESLVTVEMGPNLFAVARVVADHGLVGSALLLRDGEIVDDRERRPRRSNGMTPKL